MNYISHLSSFYTRLAADSRLTPHHISLYSGIFQLWNAERFQKLIHVNRSELMQLSHIGSVNTYIRCLKELHDWNYIQYFPSKNISFGSQIRVITFDNTSDNTTETPVRHLNKHIKTNTNIPSQKEVDDYFKNEGYPQHEAILFFSHYTTNGWMMGTSSIQDWQSAAINWMSKARNFNLNKLTASKAKKMLVETATPGIKVEFHLSQTPESLACSGAELGQNFLLNKPRARKKVPWPVCRSKAMRLRAKRRSTER